MPTSKISLAKVVAATSVAAVLLGSATPAFADEDLKCLHRAIDDRAKELRDAYEDYANDMNDTINRLSDREHDAVDIDDSGSRNNEFSRSMADFMYQMYDVWQRLNRNTQYAWDNYYRRRSQCGFGGVAPAGYGGYPSYNYNTYNPYNYNYGYGNNVRAYCSQPVLQAPPAGCNYECAPDSNGCQRCHLACRTQATYSSCGCTPSYAPVCTRDNRTYDNACFAVCSGKEVWYTGACR